MDKKIKAKWIATLRSGNYQQTRGVLRNKDNKCCCLGVLCDMESPHQWAGQTSGGSYYHGSSFKMPDRDMLRRAGLSGITVGDLAKMNDDDGASFAQIADYIERNL